MYVYYTNCNNCYMQYRIELLNPRTRAYVKPVVWCPSCGSASMVERDTNRDYWYVLADAVGLKPTASGVDLVKQLYNLWEPREHTNFVDFVKECVNDYT